MTTFESDIMKEIDDMLDSGNNLFIEQKFN